MINYHQLKRIVPVACIAMLTLYSSAFAQSIDATSARQINVANELVRAGKVTEAIEIYQQVPADPQIADQLNYNTAVARYRSGDFDSAERLFMESASSTNTSIAANGRYNLGNCLYGKAVQLAETDKHAAIENLRNAINHYRGALRSDANNPDARANIELAAELIRKLEKEQKQEEQDQQKDQPQDQQESEDQPNRSDSQEAESQKPDSSNQENSDEQNSRQDQQQSEQKESQGNDSQQSDSEESKGDQQDQFEQQNDSQSEEQNKSESKQRNQSQPQNQQQNSRDQQQPDDAAAESEEETSDKPVPTGDLQAADEQDESRKPNGGVSMVDPNEKDRLMSKEEAMKMLQAVRDRDMLRRLRQERIERSRHTPVDRDW